MMNFLIFFACCCILLIFWGLWCTINACDEKEFFSGGTRVVLGLTGLLFSLLFTLRRLDGSIILDVLGEIALGFVLGGIIVLGVGLVLLAGAVLVMEVGERRVALVPTHVRAVSPSAPRTLRWMRGLLPGGEGTVWLAEVASTLAEISDKKVRRQYIRSYRRAMPWLVWTSWAEYLSVSRRRELL